MKRVISIITPMVVVATVVVSALLYPHLPESMVSHWDASGAPDGHMSRAWGTFLLPGFLVIIYLVLLAVPAIDPLRKNIQKFRSWYDGFIFFFVLFMTYVHGLTLAFNLGYTFNMTVMIMPVMGPLFILIGLMLGKAKRNFFIGIRTPWTLSSDKVWKETHRLGQRLFIVSGVIALVGIILPAHAVVLLIVPVSVSSLYLVVFSYFSYRREEQS